jgi:hypothetical protein
MDACPPNPASRCEHCLFGVICRRVAHLSVDTVEIDMREELIS